MLPANYSDTYLAKGDTVTITCRDTVGIPAPNITWRIGGRDVEGDDDGIEISTATGLVVRCSLEGCRTEESVLIS